MMKYFPLFFLLFIFFLSNFGAAAYPENTLRKHNFCLHFEAADSNHALEALSILQRASNEMVLDFKITPVDTFKIILAPSRSYFRQYIHGRLPNWTQGFAMTDQNVMVIKSPRWDRPEVNFKQTLTHELLHLFLSARTNRGKIPRWLNEGLALFYAERSQWDTKTTLSKAVFTNSVIPLQAIDHVLTFERHRAELAYQESYSAVSYLLSTYDIEALNTILDGIKIHRPLDDSFLQATGSSFKDFETEWLKHLEKTQKWFWLSDFYDFIWIFILLLLLLVGVLIRLRNRKKMSAWERDEMLEDWQNPALPDEEAPWESEIDDNPPFSSSDDTPDNELRYQ